MKTYFTSLLKTWFLILIAITSWQSGNAQLTPGEGGTMPVFTPFSALPGKIGGLYVSSSERENIWFSEGTRAVVNLYFPYPSVYAAESYTLQYSTDDGASWHNYQNMGADLTTTNNNFSLYFDQNYKLRLFVNGGTYNGFTSNEVYAQLSVVDTRFAGWSMDQSMFITGVMFPFVGYGIQTSVTVKKLSDDSVVDSALTYQWYRTNPVTYEQTLITGATNTKYITTMDDAGYFLTMRASGDQTKAGGFMDMNTGVKTVVPNRAFVSNISPTGFTLNLYKLVSGLKAADFVITDKRGDSVTINSLNQGENAAIYNFSVQLCDTLCPYHMRNISEFWHIASIFGNAQFQMMEEGVMFSILTGLNSINSNATRIYLLPAANELNFVTDCTINQAAVYSLSGKLLSLTTVRTNHGTINTSGLVNGMYILRLVSSEGVQVRKFEIAR